MHGFLYVRTYVCRVCMHVFTLVCECVCSMYVFFVVCMCMLQACIYSHGMIVCEKRYSDSLAVLIGVNQCKSVLSYPDYGIMSTITIIVDADAFLYLI